MKKKGAADVSESLVNRVVWILFFVIIVAGVYFLINRLIS
jgi:hypothetical protein